MEKENFKEIGRIDKPKLDLKFDKAKQNITFCMIAKSLDLKEEVLKKYTSQIEECAKEYDNCKNCKGLEFCKNDIEGSMLKASKRGNGVDISVERFSEICLKLQGEGATNINLVTPTIYVYQIIEAIKKAKAMGLHIPIVYNTCAYETVDTIKMLDGLIDIYLPDLKYYADNIAIKYSTAPHYFENATAVIKEMQRQVGENVFDENGIMQKGMIIRHLILPNHIQNTKHVLKWIKENLPEGTYVSVMAQYFPTYKAKEDESISRKINQKEYDEIEAYLRELDLENGYIQELGKHEEEYVPNFDLSNIEK